MTLPPDANLHSLALRASHKARRKLRAAHFDEYYALLDQDTPHPRSRTGDATHRLRLNHLDEYAEILAQERTALGLHPTSNSSATIGALRQRITDLEAQVERLEAVLYMPQEETQ